jgi:predicted dehydrogenase
VAVVGTALFYKPDAYFEAGDGWRRKPGGGPILLNLIHEVNNLPSLVGDVTAVQAMNSNAIRASSQRPFAIRSRWCAAMCTGVLTAP